VSNSTYHTSFCFQAEDGTRDLVRSRGFGDVYKRQLFIRTLLTFMTIMKLMYRHYMKDRSQKVVMAGIIIQTGKK